jgi:hypothetical protein
MTDDLLYQIDKQKHKQNVDKNAWKKGPRISLKNCMEGTGEMQKTTLKEILGNKFMPDDEMKFGKYRGKPLKWVKENDEGYWNWAIDNIPNFDKLAAKTP